MRRRRETVPTPPPRDGVGPWLALDAVLKDRLRAALAAERPLAESELRKLDDEGRACLLMLAAALARGEDRLRELDADSASSLVDVTETFRDVSALRRDLDELASLLAELDERARAARAAWLTTSSRSSR